MQLNIVAKCSRFTANRTQILARNRQLIAFIVFFISRYDYQIIPYDFGFVDSSIHANPSGPMQCHPPSEGTTEAVPPQHAGILVVCNRLLLLIGKIGR